LGYFFPWLCYALVLTINAFGYILGDFFDNSSGVDVMITILGDFRHFSAKILAFFLKNNAMIKFLHSLSLSFQERSERAKRANVVSGMVEFMQKKILARPHRGRGMLSVCLSVCLSVYATLSNNF
jgi:hypothetical protein